jgi:hypothetical protein
MLCFITALNHSIANPPEGNAVPMEKKVTVKIEVTPKKEPDVEKVIVGGKLTRIVYAIEVAGVGVVTEGYVFKE